MHRIRPPLPVGSRGPPDGRGTSDERRRGTMRLTRSEQLAVRTIRASYAKKKAERAAFIAKGRAKLGRPLVAS